MIIHEKISEILLSTSLFKKESRWVLIQFVCKGEVVHVSP